MEHGTFDSFVELFCVKIGFTLPHIELFASMRAERNLPVGISGTTANNGHIDRVLLHHFNRGCGPRVHDISNLYQINQNHHRSAAALTKSPAIQCVCRVCVLSLNSLS